MNHYELLGVEKTAQAEDIKKAYRKLASQHHPDKGGDTKKFQEIQVAYDILSNDNKRSQYDAELAGGGHRQFHFNSGGMNPEDAGGMNSIFEQMAQQFGFGFRGGDDPFAQFRNANQNRQEPRNRDVKIAVQVKMVDTLQEHDKNITLALPGKSKENISIKVPRGISTGATVRYQGLGDHTTAPKAPRGDLYVQFHVQPEYNFEPHGIDIITHININCLEAITGCEKKVKGIDEKMFELVIPPGTQVGTKFGIQGQGLFTTDHPHRGRLIVVVDIYIPKGLSEEQLKTIKSVQDVL
jgi:DnaJ-class molecular chaperone